MSELEWKRVLQAKSHGLPCTGALPAAPYLLPRSSPGRATPGCSQRFGLQPGVLLKVHRTSTRGAVWVMCVNDNKFCCQIALLGAKFRSYIPLLKHHPVSSLPEGELLPMIPSLAVPHTIANLHFFITRPPNLRVCHGSLGWVHCSLRWDCASSLAHAFNILFFQPPLK